MKKITLLFASLLCVAYIAVAQLKLYVYQNDGTRTEFVASTVDSIAFSTITDGPDQPDPIKPVDPTNGYEYVDLGLPSGTKWASRNIGATAVGDYGNYYSWGETQTKQSYTWSTYTLGTDSTSLTKYNFHSKQGVVDNRLRLELADDAANANWGGKWRMPTRAEWQELLENCFWVWGSQPASNGFFINGYLITGPSGNSIFLPASGYKQDKLVQQPGVDAYYATSEILRSYFPDEQVSFYISSSAKRLDTQYRQLGLPVRPVYDEKLSIVDDKVYPKPENNTVYYVSGNIPTPVNAYIWYEDPLRPSRPSDDIGVVPWPGEQMQSENGIYSYHIGTNQVNRIIFNSLNSKTEDLILDLSRPYYYNGAWYASLAEIDAKRYNTLKADTVVVKDGDYYYAKLGLSSGTKWAIMNVGASTADEYGDYFAWGETEPKETYNWSTYKWCEGSYDTQTKYCKVDNNIVLDLEDDAANANWGANWTMPTYEEQLELRDDCRLTRVTKCGVYGSKFTGPNGVAVFLPAAGCRNDSGVNGAGSSGGYWSSSLRTSYSGYVYDLLYVTTNYVESYYYRSCGRSVRPVLRDVEFTFTIMFDGNGGEGSMPAIDCQHSDNVTIPLSSTFTREGYFVATWNTKADGTGKSYKVGQAIQLTENLTLYAQWKPLSGASNGYTWVDLGLPSGTKWATINVGADSPEEYGDYFAWGETTTKSTYTRSNYNYSSNATTLPLDRDAAYTNWGNSWRMPTRTEQNELGNTSYTTWTWTTQNGVKGYKVTSKINGNSIFLPAAGSRYGSDLYSAGSSGYYWSSSLSTDLSGYAYGLSFNSSDVSSINTNRYDGQSVRPVLAK